MKTTGSKHMQTLGLHEIQTRSQILFVGIMSKAQEGKHVLQKNMLETANELFQTTHPSNAGCLQPFQWHITAESQRNGFQTAMKIDETRDRWLGWMKMSVDDFPCQEKQKW